MLDLIKGKKVYREKNKKQRRHKIKQKNNFLMQILCLEVGIKELKSVRSMWSF